MLVSKLGALPRSLQVPPFHDLERPYMRVLYVHELKTLG